MKVTFWGVRGSIPVSNPETVRYGGNTACLTLECDGTLLIFDSGTGIRPLGESLVREGKQKILHLLISHTHWDHIQGFPFFAPIFIPGYTIHIYGPRHHDYSLEDRITGLLEYSYFPVSALQLQAKLIFHDLTEEVFSIESARIQTQFLNHPVFMLGYRVEYQDKVFIYTGDNEPYYNFMVESGAANMPEEDGSKIVDYIEASNQRVVDFIKGADVLVCDAQYTDEEYAIKKGWGHTSYSQALSLSLKGKVKTVSLFHHDPNRTDQELEYVVEQLQRQVRENGMKGETHLLKIVAAKQGESIVF